MWSFNFLTLPDVTKSVSTKEKDVLVFMDFAFFFGIFSFYQLPISFFIPCFFFSYLLSCLDDQQKELNTNFQSSAIVLKFLCTF